MPSQRPQWRLAWPCMTGTLAMPASDSDCRIAAPPGRRRPDHGSAQDVGYETLCRAGASRLMEFRLRNSSAAIHDKCCTVHYIIGAARHKSAAYSAAILIGAAMHDECCSTLTVLYYIIGAEIHYKC
jgi:hypothetical protein